MTASTATSGTSASSGINSHQGTALITGASSGIGAVYADRLARRGYDLIVVARNRGRLATLAERLTSETGRCVEIVTADLGADADVRRLETLLRTDASITMLVNNAGIGAAGPLLQSDADKMAAMIALNVTALTRLTYAAAHGLVARGKGTIINIASIVALAPELLNGVYGGSKAFVLAFTQSLQHELADKGVRVQAVLPGAIRTEFWDVAGQPVDNLPQEWVMSADDLVDAALSGLDQGEVVTLPSLPDVADWHAFEAARAALGPNLSRSVPAARFRLA
ncbi:SDR family NAD(P)-dependent oxidoreductase [Cupriavidus sp. YAF13]|uniref:SDR family NAD(P)-dependent oxidoreductase n=1 Tax=Cupriavidus sp. YAF13 TaxID=3233075 RepID=UPI003F919DC9